MKIFLISALLISASYGFAQEEQSSSLRLGAGRAHDFPGLNGYFIYAEYLQPISSRLKAGFGMKHINMTGYPRTFLVKEFTKALSINFTLYGEVLQTERHVARAGIGYAFSLYKARRSYPSSQLHSPDQPTHWPIVDSKGRTSGFQLVAEYEYLFTTDFSMGIKAGWTKAYDRITFVGPFAAIRF